MADRWQGPKSTSLQDQPVAAERMAHLTPRGLSPRGDNQTLNPMRSLRAQTAARHQQSTMRLRVEFGRVRHVFSSHGEATVDANRQDIRDLPAFSGISAHSGECRPNCKLLSAADLLSFIVCPCKHKHTQAQATTFPEHPHMQSNRTRMTMPTTCRAQSASGGPTQLLRAGVSNPGSAPRVQSVFDPFVHLQTEKQIVTLRADLMTIRQPGELR